jgi:hypothetical protein
MKNKTFKILIVILCLITLTGCGLNLKSASYQDICKYVVGNKRKMYNQVNKGYKYYVPRNMNIRYIDDYNVIINGDSNNYYLYVDVISYYNNVKMEYKTDSSLYYSSHIKGNDGLLNITKLSDSYLINIQYNYAKLEVKVKESEVKSAISNALIIVNSISYNQETIKAMLDEGVLSTNEKIVDVFATKDKSNDTLEVNDEYEYEEDDNYDRDYIN